MIDRLHPITLLIYFLYAALIPAFSRNPFLHGLALVTGFVMLFTWSDHIKILKKVPFFILFFIVISLFNPFFYHNGNTVLFYLSGRRITLEALLFGADSALMVVGVIVWFISLSHYMTGEKVLYLFGKVSTKLATIVSLVMRLIPHYTEYIRKYRAHQRLLGIYGDGSFLEVVRAEVKIFAGFLTWILEHSMTTADSFISRGYGVTRRKSYKPFRFRTVDTIIIVGTFAVLGIMVAALVKGMFYTEYYPTIILLETTVPVICAEGLYVLSSLYLSIHHFASVNSPLYRQMAR
jgi:energy-coupling factor transport system permease protein